MTKAEGSKPAQTELKADTKVTTGGRNPHAHHGYVNTPVYRLQKLTPAPPWVISPTGQICRAHADVRLACPEIEGRPAPRWRCAVGPCRGRRRSFSVLNWRLCLVATAAMAPTRTFCDTVLTRCGVTTTYYDPLVGAGIAALMQPNTRAVFTETPGSLTFEVQDIPAIAAVAHQNNALVLMDNTWAGPLYFKALEKGADLAVQSGSKYIGGHSDLMLGTVSANQAAAQRLKDTAYTMGLCVGPDDMNLGLRGLRTLAVRLRQHHQSGLKVAQWFAQRPEVAKVLIRRCPAPGHDIWKRDFTGACGLFSIVLNPFRKGGAGFPQRAVGFGIGVSGAASRASRFLCSRWRPSHRDEIRTGRPDGPLPHRT